MSSHIVISGATGLIGSALIPVLIRNGFTVTGLSRHPQKNKVNSQEFGVNWVMWKGGFDADVLKVIENAQAVIHLAGAGLFDARWTPAYKKLIRSSRIESTKSLVNMMKSAHQKPGVFISGSAVGIYGSSDDQELTEDDSNGQDFLASVCNEWEQAALVAEDIGIRTVLARTGVVLDTRGGALASLLPPFKFFIGGPVLPGYQYLSWIHIQDEVNALIHILNNESISGPVNLSAPQPVTMAEFCKQLGRSLHRPSWIPVPGFGLKLVFGEVADTLTTGQRVIPQKLLKSGYSFQFSEVYPALCHLLAK